MSYKEIKDGAEKYQKEYRRVNGDDPKGFGVDGIHIACWVAAIIDELKRVDSTASHEEGSVQPDKSSVAGPILSHPFEV